MSIDDTVYYLRSVVLVERSITDRNLIVGTTTGLIKHRDIQNGIYDNTFLLYDPQGASMVFESGSQYRNNDPITYIPGDPLLYGGSGTESFTQRASTRGTIFVYSKDPSGKCVMWA